MLLIDLRGKVSVVLGGSRGIGAGIVKSLCKAGSFTVFTHTGNSKNRKKIEALKKEIMDRGELVKDVSLDALDREKTENLVNQIIDEYKKIDVLVCNVGRNLVRTVENITYEEWQHFIDLNLSSTFYGIKAVLPSMLKRKYGKLILIGSSAVYDGGGGAVDYAAAKAGLVGIMKYLARRYTRKGIITNVVHPCVIDTDLVRERYSTEQQWKKLVSQIPVGRVGTADDVGGLVAYLASSHGDYICGQEILLDGGRTLFGR